VSVGFSQQKDVTCCLCSILSLVLILPSRMTFFLRYGSDSTRNFTFSPPARFEGGRVLSLVLFANTSPKENSSLVWSHPPPAMRNFLARQLKLPFGPPFSPLKSWSAVLPQDRSRFVSSSHPPAPFSIGIKPLSPALTGHGRYRLASFSRNRFFRVR